MGAVGGSGMVLVVLYCTGICPLWCISDYAELDMTRYCQIWLDLTECGNGDPVMDVSRGNLMPLSTILASELPSEQRR